MNVPPSKKHGSSCHYLCITCEEEKSIIRHIEYSKDIEATISAMKALGTMIFQYDDYLEIDGTTTFYEKYV